VRFMKGSILQAGAPGMRLRSSGVNAGMGLAPGCWASREHYSLKGSGTQDCSDLVFQMTLDWTEEFGNPESGFRLR
jgi:hypothetical protein